MPAATRKPATGDRVTVADTYDDDRRHLGKVVDLLSIQFTYQDDAGKIRFCHYAGDWQYDQARRTQSRKTTTRNTRKDHDQAQPRALAFDF